MEEAKEGGSRAEPRCERRRGVARRFVASLSREPALRFGVARPRCSWIRRGPSGVARVISLVAAAPCSRLRRDCYLQAKRSYFFLIIPKT